MVVETLTWMPDGDSFLSVEAASPIAASPSSPTVEQSVVTRIDIKGNALDSYDLGRIKLYDVAVMPDSTRIVGVGTLLESPTGLKPSKSRDEKRLVVYNLETKQVESQTPVLNDVRDITIAQARSGTIALISYENKAPPQLWKIELIKEPDNNTMVARLILRHTYMPKMPVDFAGPSYFGGQNNELVLCAGKAGDIHIWDQESAALLHLIPAKVHGGDLTCIAWNHAAEDPYMFATGSHDGGVRVWTRLSDELDDPAHFPISRALRFDRLNIPRSFSPDDDDNNSTRSTQGSTNSRRRGRPRALSISSSASSR
ncbi:hypothetical protein EST38_g12934 [Candolleomyces aberdarensis]|uniref:Uncharacterized protein n=1 Tax=Candolleomyces aberdarensis TaxID=2316362 RepID=A0A4Q2D172_9AGAR|nr:hypothetical protein EST38_g12934 [Candolleomyces aberdarensis]